jgi:ABC-type sugar transport system ATPase subunit
VLGRPVRRWSVQRAIVDGVLYVPPERATDSIFASASAGHNVSIGVLDHLRWPVVRLISPGRERRTVRRLIERRRVKVSSPRTLAGELSGGNQQKLVFARWLDRRCRVLVLDDPTRGIDVATREELYATIRSLAAGGAAILLRSESLEELIGLSNRIVVVRRGAATTVVDCPVDAKPDELAVVRHMI